MACPEVTIQTILGTECIGDSLPKINTNFSTLGDAACDLITDVGALSAYTVSKFPVTNANIAFDGGSFAFRNKIINGDAKISQRYSTTVKVASSVDGFGFPVDRFCFTDSVGANWPTNGIIRYKQNNISDLPGFTNSVLLSTSTVGTIGVNNSCGIRQSLEGINISDLAWGTSSAQPITVSFWVKSSLTGTHSLVVNGLIDDRTTTRRYASTYNISSTSWEYKSITIPGDTTASTTWFTGTSAAGLNLIWGLGTGTNFQITPGSWGSGAGIQSSGTVNIIANAGATFEFTGVQLEKGPTATPFEHRPIGTELSLCQRYYEQGRENTSRFGDTAMTNEYWVSFKVTKRDAPALALVLNSGSSSNVTNQQLIASYVDGIYIQWSATIAGQDAAPRMTYKADAEF